jgi:hypothetical protein
VLLSELRAAESSCHLSHLRFSTYFVDPDEESDGTGMAKLYLSNGRLTSRSGLTKKTEEDKRIIIVF